MSSITTGLYSGQYYQLPSQTATSTATTPSTLPAADTSLTSSDSSSAGSAYTLNLSAQAQAYLNGLNGTSSSSTDTSNVSFVLSPAQQQTLSGIIAKYKDQPMTQATYNSLQNDLKAAGLGPDQLAGQDQAKSFNSTQVLIDALNGVDDPLPDAGATQSAEQNKASNYMQQIVSQWQSMSSASSTSASGVTPVSGSEAA